MTSRNGRHNYGVMVGLDSEALLDRLKHGHKRGTGVYVPEEVILGRSVTDLLLKHFAGSGECLFLGSYALDRSEDTLTVEADNGTDAEHLTHKCLTALKTAVVNEIVELTVNTEELLCLHDPSDFLKNGFGRNASLYKLCGTDSNEALGEGVDLCINNGDLKLALEVLCDLLNTVVASRWLNVVAGAGSVKSSAGT